jgi:hypothetical protein
MDLQRHWAGGNVSIYSYMLWVITLLSTKLAWRAMEGLEADDGYFSIMWRLSKVRRDGTVDCLCVNFVV